MSDQELHSVRAAKAAQVACAAMDDLHQRLVLLQYRRPFALTPAYEAYRHVPPPFGFPLMLRAAEGRFPGAYYRGLGLTVEGGVTFDQPTNDR